jgi:hypothetical protein
MATSSSVVSSSVEFFTRVTFNEVQETYCALSDLTCQFTITATAVPKEAGDYVGIFPVGWKSVKDFVCRMPVDVPVESKTEPGDVLLSLVFTTGILPQNNNEFYQFCYVSASDLRVCGASSPFQFTLDRSTDWELVDDKDTSLFYVPQVGELGDDHEGGGDRDEMQQVASVESSADKCNKLEAEVEYLQREWQQSQKELSAKADELSACEAEYSSSLNRNQMALENASHDVLIKTKRLSSLGEQLRN